MSISRWIIAGILGLAILSVIGWSLYTTGLQLGEAEAKKSYHASRYAAYATNQIERSCLSGEGSNVAECVAKIIQSTNEDQRAQDDLIAQTKMALWAFWMLVSTVVMAVITAIGVVFVWQTLKATQDMAKDTKDIGEAQVSAHISVTDSSIEMVNDNSGAESLLYYSANFDIKNHGQTPAFNVSAYIWAHGAHKREFWSKCDPSDLDPSQSGSLSLWQRLDASVDCQRWSSNIVQLVLKYDTVFTSGMESRKPVEVRFDFSVVPNRDGSLTIMRSDYTKRDD